MDRNPFFHINDYGYNEGWKNPEYRRQIPGEKAKGLRFLF
jgi:hypothetical protein